MSANDAHFAYEGLDRVLHEKARLGIVTGLAGQRDGLSFAELKRLCALTDGNLSRHLKVLEEAGVVAIEKRFEKRRPLTTCTLTEEGRSRFLDYLGELEAVVRDAAARARGSAPAKSSRKSGPAALRPSKA